MEKGCTFPSVVSILALILFKLCIGLLLSTLYFTAPDCVYTYISVEEGCRWNMYSSTIHICSTHLFKYDDANISFVAVVHLYFLLLVICARLLIGI